MANVSLKTVGDLEGEVLSGASGSSTSPRAPSADRVFYDGGGEIEEDERVPLLLDGSFEEQRSNIGKGKRKGKKKPFYRARPLWLVPFALVASIARGMTLAPRVEVFTQLSCQRIHGIHHFETQILTTAQLFAINSTIPYAYPTSLLHLSPHIPDSAPSFTTLSIQQQQPTSLPLDGAHTVIDRGLRVLSQKCVSDPEVQAGAATLQMIMTTTMGLMSALSTGWWGEFGERYGRTRVLAGSTFGLLLTDLAFTLVSTPDSALSIKYGYALLLIAPIIEGALGGWATLQATTSAYVSDCTSSGSRAHIFSRFSGVNFLGTFIGPTIGGYLIQRSRSGGGGANVTSVFWVAVVCEFVNFLLVMFVFPESLDRMKGRVEGKSKSKGKRKVKMSVSASVRWNGNGNGNAEVEAEEGKIAGLVARLISPLAVFSPVMVREHDGLKMRRDWNLTVLAVVYSGLMICAGLSQLKYLYAEHVYGWGAEQLSWYISYLGGLRSMVLLVLLPYCIDFFKPKLAATSKGKKNATALVERGENGKKPKPTRSQLRREISFDLTLAKYSILMDMIANLLIVPSPIPTFRHSSIEAQSLGHSQALFVLVSGMGSFGTGAAPALHSLTLCILQAREMCEEGSSLVAETQTVGGLFGAFAFLQSIGSMVLGPVIFGLVYRSTVAVVPKGIFMVAAGMLGVCFLLMLLVRNSRQRKVEPERGRSRVSKDLRGGAAGYGTIIIRTVTN